jgi:acetyltransferase-like isoleucine patch superfamily enzyme
VKISLSGKSSIESENLTTLPPNLKVGKNTKICGQKIYIEEGVSIGSNTIISANYVSIGKGSTIEDDCRIILPGEQSKFIIGDNCFIGSCSKINVPIFKAGDYVILHNHLLVDGYKPCIMGHNLWVGQNCILNSTDNLTLGNNVGIGTYSSVWTHGFWGEKIEGCRVCKTAPVTIEDDAWIEGSYNVISPGIRIGKKSLVLTGSVVTKDVLPNSCVAGIPARDITEKVTPYVNVTLEQKYKMMRTFMLEFLESTANKKVTTIPDGWHVKEKCQEYDILFYETVKDKALVDDYVKIVFTKKNFLPSSHYRHISIFDLSSKTYTKKRTDIESRIIRFLFASRARFLPT